ncbi:MAG: hypothetical protein ACFFDS_01775 [Candidatus Thorarchaeota archaeon]
MAVIIPPIVIYLIAFFVPLFLTFLGLPFHIKYMLKKEIYGVDVHKKDKPKIAEVGGIIILLAIIITSIIAIILINDSTSRLAIGIFCLTITIAGIIGLVDDFKRLSAILKPALLLLASIPIIASGMYIPEPYLPFVGQTRLTIVYIILLPFVIAIPSNAVNMLDVFNGSMATTTIIVLIATFIANIIMFGFNINTLLTNIFILMTIATLIAFWAFNRYPAKVFGGDTGSLTIGAALGAIAVLGRLEVVVIIAMIPFIMNAFGIISSVRGLFERKDMARPTQMTKDWKIESTNDPKAPITLVGLVIQKGPLHEKDVVKSFNILTIVSGIFAIITAVLIKLVM